MSMPTDIGIIDLMLAVPNDDTSNYYDFIKPLLMDEQSRQMFKMPAQYMFKDVPKTGVQDDYIAYTLGKMDEFGIEKAMLGVDEDQYFTQNEAVLKHRIAFLPSMTATLTMAWRRCEKSVALKSSTLSKPSLLSPRASVLRCH